MVILIYCDNHAVDIVYVFPYYDYLIETLSLQVVDFKSPDEIRELIDLKLQDFGTDDVTILAQCRKILDYSVHTGMYM